MSASLEPLFRWLMQSPVGALRTASESGELGQLIPEWERLRGPWNIQHHAHHFPLDDHTLKVVEATQRSPIFATLTPYEQWLTALSALLHDIEKNTGPQHIYGQVPVDKLHPLKSAMSSMTILGRLGMPMDAMLRCFSLIHHHQAFGQLFIRYGEEGHAPDDELLRIARKLRSVRLTRCLLALSEGDIRSVQAENAYFTPGIEVKLHQYGEQVIDMIRARWVHQPLLPDYPNLTAINPMEQHSLDDATPLNTLSLSLWPFTDWNTLIDCLNNEAWGGAWALPKPKAGLTWADIWQPNIVAVLGLRSLPENAIISNDTALTVALETPVPTRVPMETFTQLWSDPTQAPWSAEQAVRHRQQVEAQDQQQFNPNSPAQDITPSDKVSPESTILVGTRPIVQSLWLGESPPEAVSALLETALPVIGRISTPSAYAYGRL